MPAGGPSVGHMHPRSTVSPGIGADRLDQNSQITDIFRFERRLAASMKHLSAVRNRYLCSFDARACARAPAVPRAGCICTGHIAYAAATAQPARFSTHPSCAAGLLIFTAVGAAFSLVAALIHSAPPCSALGSVAQALGVLAAQPLCAASAREACVPSRPADAAADVRSGVSAALCDEVRQLHEHWRIGRAPVALALCPFVGFAGALALFVRRGWIASKIQAPACYFARVNRVLDSLRVDFDATTLKLARRPARAEPLDAQELWRARLAEAAVLRNQAEAQGAASADGAGGVRFTGTLTGARRRVQL